LEPKKKALLLQPSNGKKNAYKKKAGIKNCDWIGFTENKGPIILEARVVELIILTTYSLSLGIIHKF
jgi:hypothetical protein